jgi:hypothetical protein
MYIHVILQSWPEYILEKFLTNFEPGGSYKNKSKGIDNGKRRGGVSKGRKGIDNKYGSKAVEGAQNFEEFFKLALEDNSPDCRYYSRQAFLTYYEIWPEEAEPLIVQHKTTFKKHQEMVNKLGHLFDGSSTTKGLGSEYSKTSYVKKERERERDRKTEKVISDSRGFLPTGIPNRRADAAPKSQNRVKSNSKFLSEEREKPDLPRPVDSNKASLSTGFRNLKATNYKNPPDNNVYVSKYQNNNKFSNKQKRSVSKDVIGTYKSSGLTAGYKNGVIENEHKILNEPDLMELDEKCMDISEIEIDPEDNKEETLYPQPYQGYNLSNKKSPREEIADLLRKAESSNWIDRINAFEQLTSYLSNKAQFLPDVSMFCKIVNLHFDHLDDPHFKIILVVHKNFGKLIHNFGETMEPYLSEIIPRLLVNLSDKREKVNNSANILLNLLIQRYGGDKLLEYFTEVLDVKENVVVIGAALEVLSNKLIKDSDKYFRVKTNIKNIIKRIGKIVYEFSTDKAMTMPALG